MKNYFPTDKNGNQLAFMTPEECVYDSNNKTLATKLSEINQAIDDAQSEANIPDGLSYDQTTGDLSLDKSSTHIDTVNIGVVPDTISYDESSDTLSLKRGNTTISQTTVRTSGGGGIPIGPCTNLSIEPDEGSVTIKWSDPVDSVVDGVTIASWAGTKLIYKAGGYPESVTDGTQVLDNKTRNAYSSTGYTLNGLTDGTTYYFRLFPYSAGLNYNLDTSNQISGTPGKAPIIYGFRIDAGETDPYESVSYIRGCKNENYKPAHMDFTNDAFDYGDWEDAFFMPKPCMLKYDGTVDYYLNPNDYTKKEDGTASDITNTAFDGNAMMEWGRDGKKIWVKVVPDSGSSKSASVYIAEEQVDSGYKAWSFINNQGNMVDHFYTPIYNGSYISSKMRSLSGKTCGVSQSATTEINYAKANNKTSNVLWYTEVLADRILINFLLILLCKSLDTQAKFGQGHTSNNSNAINTGTMNNKGLFWGDKGGVNGVKVFGMENWWGNIWRRTAGCIMNGYNQKIKLTYGTQDGSSASEYNTDGTGYISENTVSDSGYISEMTFDATRAIMVPKTGSGSSSTYYADHMYTPSSGGTCYAFFGGNWVDSARCGAFCANLVRAASNAAADLGAALSCKPLS
jgi:hypothetical protein